MSTAEEVRLNLQNGLRPVHAYGVHANVSQRASIKQTSVEASGGMKLNTFTQVQH